MSEIHLDGIKTNRGLVNGLRDHDWGNEVKVFDAQTGKLKYVDKHPKSFEQIIEDKNNLRKRNPQKEGLSYKKEAF